MIRTEEAIHLRSLFCQYGQNMDLKIQLIKEMRDIAILYLPEKVITKVPKSHGISTEWNLTIRGDTGIDSFYFSASKANLTVSQKSAANLLFYCARVIEDNAPLDSYLEAILSNYSMLSIDDARTGEVFKKGREKGAVSHAMDYLKRVVKELPDATAAEQADFVFSNAGKEGSPYGLDDPTDPDSEIIYIKDKNGTSGPDQNRDQILKKIYKARHASKNREK